MLERLLVSGNGMSWVYCEIHCCSLWFGFYLCYGFIGCLEIDEGICMVAGSDDSFMVFVWNSAFEAMNVKTSLKC